VTASDAVTLRTVGGSRRRSGVTATQPEGAPAVLRFGIERLQLKEIVSFTSVGKAKSRRVTAKIGMTPRIAATSPLSRHVPIESRPQRFFER
jgi:hypothetical protein